MNKKGSFQSKTIEKLHKCKIVCSNFLGSHRFLDASLSELSSIKTSFSTLDSNGLKIDLLGKNLAYP